MLELGRPSYAAYLPSIRSTKDLDEAGRFSPTLGHAPRPRYARVMCGRGRLSSDVSKINDEV
jgi:hypothetical protein